MDVISIIVPVYNVTPYIHEGLHSIQRQSYKDLEIILVDDGSTDGSGDICDLFSRNDSRFKVIHKPNGGVSSARNAGINAATGGYIAFVDPDDYIAPNFYERLMFALLENDADLAVSGTEYITENGNLLAPSITDRFKGKYTIYENNSDVIDGILETRINCDSWSKLYKREFWGSSRYPLDLSLGEDVATVIPVCAEANKVVYCPDAVYFYRKRKNSLLNRTVSKDRFIENSCGTEIVRNCLLEKAPNRADEINKLKMFYDSGIAFGYFKSLRTTKKERKSSRAFDLYNCFLEVATFIKQRTADTKD